MNILQAAERAGLTTKALRYYEEVGLIKAVRRPNGYRDYDEKDVNKLKFLARARGLGFSIEDCRELLALWEDEQRASGDVRAIATSRIQEIDTKIAELQSLKATLSRLVASCHGDQRHDCPIIEDLAGEIPAARAS